MFAVTRASLLFVGRLSVHVSACERGCESPSILHMSLLTEVGFRGALPGAIFFNSVVKMSEPHLTSLMNETHLEGVPIATPTFDSQDCR